MAVAARAVFAGVFGSDYQQKWSLRSIPGSIYATMHKARLLHQVKTVIGYLLVASIQFIIASLVVLVARAISKLHIGGGT